MRYDNLIGKTIKIKDVPQNSPCFNCTPCVRLRLMELCLIEGQQIKLTKHSLGLWIVKILSDNGDTTSTLALREEELDRILIEDESCMFSLI
jgi:Fe2+ transport system protein FeoA